VGIEVEDDLRGRLGMGIEEEVDNQPLDRGRLMRDPAVAVDHRHAVLRPIERALAGQRRTPAVLGREPAEHHAHDRIVPQLVMIDQVLVAKRDAQHPLADKGRNVLHGSVARVTIREASGEPLDQPDPSPRAAAHRHSR
jgi:hypothetical protein